jgi:prepilin-type N-terminal cleavage/methylation domain-containing protein
MGAAGSSGGIQVVCARKPVRRARARGTMERPMKRERGPKASSGFSLIEVVVGAAVLAVALLAMAAMFPTGYTNITEAGKVTMALTGARQILEDISALPFDNIGNLNGFDTQNPATLPAGEPERMIGRRWRYALAGEGNGFTFNTAEKNEWSTLSTGGFILNGRGLISTAGLSATLIQVTVTITYPGRSTGVTLITNISRL